MKAKSRNRSLPPSRAQLATMPDGRMASATWVKTEDGWKCLSASRALRWMRGMDDLDHASHMMQKKTFGTTWHWIEPQGRAVEPPFKP